MSIVVRTQTLNRDNEDTLTQSIYYQYTIINTKRTMVYLYSMYDLYWEYEHGLSIVFTLPTHIGIKDKKRKKKAENIRWALR
jgi:hypothetical protein